MNNSNPRNSRKLQLPQAEIASFIISRFSTTNGRADRLDHCNKPLCLAEYVSSNHKAYCVHQRPLWARQAVPYFWRPSSVGRLIIVLMVHHYCSSLAPSVRDLNDVVETWLLVRTRVSAGPTVINTLIFWASTIGLDAFMLLLSRYFSLLSEAYIHSLWSPGI